MLKVLLPVVALAFAPAAFADHGHDHGGHHGGHQAAHHHGGHHHHNSKDTCAGDFSTWSLKECNTCCDPKKPETKGYACHDMCQDVQKCWAQYSQDGNRYNDCVANAHRKMGAKEAGVGGTNADGDKRVVTDVDNFDYYGGEDGGDKGFNEAR